ncbi:AAA family ATPase [Flagellimonas marinaquae]|jgi:putative ATP-dependent endonuclease of OLD family|uniref:ATP-dependent nuclease n=1 Tax=Yeosuana marina TaxID=1565536 RepID=UPI001CE22466|nr:AAA family ATPase [Allomuricauda aquimarina]|tara:strand:- start:7812 stop:9941 length:2130 start_codon:yes stop_codon:yes gene_type:complete
MYISNVSIVNYKSFRNAKFSFKEGINTIIGENGSGKTNLFRAIRLLLDDNLLRMSYKLDESDFNRHLGAWKGHWIIISIEFSNLSPDEEIQALFVHGTGDVTEEPLTKATYTLLFRPKPDIRIRLSELADGDTVGLEAILDSLSIDDYETKFTGKSTVDFNDENVYKDIVGDFENVKFPFPDDTSKIGILIPHQLSISREVSFTFIKALRDVVSDFHNNRTNPLLTLLKAKSEDIDEDEYANISNQVSELNESIEQLQDVLDVTDNISQTIKETVGETYSPSSLSIKSSLSDEANKLLQSLKLFIGEPGEDYEGGIHELSLGGANLIYLTLKLLEFKYQKANETFANFLLIEEPEAHIHTHIQKSLFDKLNYGDTQIIYSTHSTQISEVSNLSNINVLSKKENYAVAYQPANGLDEPRIIKLERYLDAIRTNLLFAKGVILVEGDAEEILIPSLIKKVLGFSLDEIGVSIINIRSTGFENIADIFHDDRIQRNCAILTDLDTSIADVAIQDGDSDAIKKYKTKCYNSEKKGKERQEKIAEYINDNRWIEAFYAHHTFEVDFAMLNQPEVVTGIVEQVYSDPDTIDLAKEQLASDEVAIVGKRILTMAKQEGKGWFAILLGSSIDHNTKIPNYILNAIRFATPKMNREIIAGIFNHRIKTHLKDANGFNFNDLEINLRRYRNNEIELPEILDEFEALVLDDRGLDFLRLL